MGIREIFEEFDGENHNPLDDHDIDALTGLCELVSSSKDDEKSNRLYQNCLIDLENCLAKKVRKSNLNDDELDSLIEAFRNVKMMMEKFVGEDFDGLMVFDSFQRILMGAKGKDGC